MKRSNKELETIDCTEDHSIGNEKKAKKRIRIDMENPLECMTDEEDVVVQGTSLSPSTAHSSNEFSFPTPRDCYKSILNRVSRTTENQAERFWYDFHIKGMKMTIFGFKVELSKILKHLEDGILPKVINILAFSEIFFDIEEIVLPGTCLNIISPIWKVSTKPTKIVLSGKAGSDHQPCTANVDTDGMMGNPGKSSGHFFGAFDTSHFNPVTVLEKLSIVTNGGNGGKGQHAGPTSDRNGKARAAYRSNEPNTSDEHIPFVKSIEGDRTTFEFRNFGRGERGLNGKDGGKGGRGGIPGTVKIVSFDAEILVNDIGCVGEEGTGGNGAVGGRGQRDGDSWHETYLETSILGIWNRTNWTDGFYSENFTFGPSGDCGSYGRSELAGLFPDVVPHHDELKQFQFF